MDKNLKIMEQYCNVDLEWGVLGRHRVNTDDGEIWVKDVKNGNGEVTCHISFDQQKFYTRSGRVHTIYMRKKQPHIKVKRGLEEQKCKTKYKYVKVWKLLVNAQYGVPIKEMGGKKVHLKDKSLGFCLSNMVICDRNQRPEKAKVGSTPLFFVPEGHKRGDKTYVFTDRRALLARMSLAPGGPKLTLNQISRFLGSGRKWKGNEHFPQGGHFYYNEPKAPVWYPLVHPVTDKVVPGHFLSISRLVKMPGGRVVAGRHRGSEVWFSLGKETFSFTQLQKALVE